MDTFAVLRFHYASMHIYMSYTYVSHDNRGKIGLQTTRHWLVKTNK